MKFLGRDLLVITIRVRIKVPFCAGPGRGHYTGKDARNLHEEGNGVVRGAGHQDDVGHCKLGFQLEVLQ